MAPDAARPLGRWRRREDGGEPRRIYAKRLLRLLRYEVKARYTLGSVVGAAVYAVLMVWTALSTPRSVAAHLVVPLLTAAFILPGPGVGLTKTDVDFVYATQADPAEVLLLRAAATVLPQLALAVAVSALLVSASPAGLPCYAASLVFLSMFSMLAGAAVGLASLHVKTAVVVLGFLLMFASFFRPELLPTYGLVSPSPLYAAYSGALAALVYALFPRRKIRELAVNAYGILAVTMPRVSGPQGRAAAHARFGTPWRAVWVTSSMFYRRRGETLSRESALKPGLAASLVAAAAGYAAARLLPDLAAVVLTFQYFLALITFFGVAGSTVMGERLWLSLSGDADLYFKYRMLARSALAAVFASPLAAEAAALAPLFPPALYLMPALASIPLVVPAASWLAAAYSGLPQMRELNLPQSPPRMSLRSYLAPVLMIAYYLFASSPYYMAVAAFYIGALSRLLYAAALAWSAASLALSALFFYATTLSRWRRAVWSWLVNRLLENGYV
jgi:hypothetical protein